MRPWPAKCIALLARHAGLPSLIIAIFAYATTFMIRGPVACTLHLQSVILHMSCASGSSKPAYKRG
jgi:hypothetical protein